MIKVRLKELLFQKRTHKLNKREIARFCGQLQMLLSSGVPLLSAFQIIKNMSPRIECESMIKKISDGEPVAEALEQHFPPFVISSLRGAERIGSLEEVLVRLNQYYEDRAEVEAKIKSALIYPSFVIALCLLSFVVMLMFVLPGFKTLFADFEADLPLFTLIIMSVSDILSKVWYVPILLLLAAVVLLKRYRQTSSGALATDKLVLRIKAIRQEQIINSFRTLGSLLQGGVPIIEALKTTIGSLTNQAFRRILLEIKEAVENGERLSDSLAKQGLFPKESIQMISVGEDSGKLAEMLLNVSSFYEKEKELSIKRFMTLLEPAMTLVVGVVVGVIAFSMFLPMMNMISQLQ
ncbi:MAG: type II secretion system F family protein [Candidatus Margulisiibacteriota bacterium]